MSNSSTTSDSERHPLDSTDWDSTESDATDWDATLHLTVTLLRTPTLDLRPANRSERRKDIFVRAVRLHFFSALWSTLRGETRDANATGRNITPRNKADTLLLAKLRRGTANATNSDAMVPFGTIRVFRALPFDNTRDGDEF
jgi:hypothetical protein